MIIDKKKRKIYIGKHKCKYLKSNENVVIEGYSDLETGYIEWYFVNCIEYNTFIITRCPFCSKKLQRKQILSRNVEKFMENIVNYTWFFE